MDVDMSRTLVILLVMAGQRGWLMAAWVCRWSWRLLVGFGSLDVEDQVTEVQQRPSGRVETGVHQCPTVRGLQFELGLITLRRQRVRDSIDENMYVASRSRQGLGDKLTTRSKVPKVISRALLGFLSET